MTSASTNLEWVDDAETIRGRGTAYRTTENAETSRSIRWFDVGAA